MSFTKKRIMLPEYTGDGRKDFDALKKAISDYQMSLETKAALSIETEIVKVQGLQFPATQVASADVNTLDDYKEGSWTPVLTFATPGTLSVAYTVQTGDFTKKGRDVRVSCSIITSAFTLGTAAGALRVTGLPYNIGGAANQGHFGALEWAGITKAGYTSVVARALSGAGTFIDFLASGSGQAAAQITAADTPTGGTMRLEFTLEYRI